MKKAVFFALAALAIAAVPEYKIATTIKIGGEGRWDDLYVDSANHRLYVAHNSQVEVIDTVTDTLVGTISNTPAVHGIAVANDLGKGFITTGNPGNKVIIFDLVTLKATGATGAGQNPDAISYDPLSHRIVTMNDRGSDATIIDARTGEVVTLSLPLGGKPDRFRRRMAKVTSTRISKIKRTNRRLLRLRSKIPRSQNTIQPIPATAQAVWLSIP